MEEKIWLVVSNRDNRNELIAAECESLTGERPVKGIAEGGRIDLVPHSAYLKAGLQVLGQGKTIEELAGKIRRLELAVDGFRIELLNTAEKSQLPRHETIVRLADAIQGWPKLDAPKHKLLLISHDGGFTFGKILTEPDHSYRQHDGKPYRTSSSLPAQLARALVNLVAPSAKTILDPCCGTGSILLEARAMGLEGLGGDWNPKMVRMSRQNLSYFAYGAQIELGDAREWPEKVDAVVTDLPYGKNLEVSEAVIRGILAHVRTLASVAVFVAGNDLSAWLAKAGYTSIEVFRVPKYTGFTRYVHRVS